MQRKWMRRALVITQNAVNNLLPPVLNMVISFLVIRLNSETLWGSFVPIMIVVQFVAHLASWSNKEYLLREFSLHPDQISRNWQQVFSTRILLFIGLCIPLLFLGYSAQRFVLMGMWGAALLLSQSFEVMIVYRKQFLLATLVEAASVAVMAVVVTLTSHHLTVDGLLLLFALTVFTKAAVYALRFSEVLNGFTFSVNLDYYRAALSFFLLGFSGLLASRIDLYSVSYFLTEKDVAHYQVFINLMLYLQATSAFITTPYVKNIYRLNDEAIFKIALRLFLLGTLLVIPITLIIDVLLAWIYDIHYSALFVILGGLFVLPIYGYLPLVHRLYKRNEQNIVLWANLVGAGINFILNAVLLPEMGIIGAMLSSAFIQWGMLLLYIMISRKSHVMPQVPQTA